MFVLISTQPVCPHPQRQKGRGPVQGADPEQRRPPQALGRKRGPGTMRGSLCLHPPSRLPGSGSPVKPHCPPPPAPKSPSMCEINRQHLPWAGPCSRLRVQGTGPGGKADHPQCSQRPPMSPDHPQPCNPSSSTHDPSSRPWYLLFPLHLRGTQSPLGVPFPGSPPGPVAPLKPLTLGTHCFT